MKKLAFSLCLAWFASAAFAHGPAPQKVEESIVIDAPPEAVWGIIKDFDRIDSWFPLVTKSTGQGGNEVGATRELTLKDGGTVKEELKKYDSGKMSLSYAITDMSTVKQIQHAGEEVEVKALPVNSYKAWIEVEPGGGAGSKVTWKARYYRGYLKNDPPPELNEDAANQAVTQALKSGLENLKKIAESQSK